MIRLPQPPQTIGTPATPEQFARKFIDIQNNYGVGNDQTPLNYLLDINKINVKLLSYKFNMQELPRKEILTEDLLFTKLGWVYHFNTWPKPTPRYWMEKTYRGLYE